MSKPRIALGQAVLIEVIAIVVGSTFFLPGGQDLHQFYRPVSEGCVACGFVPFHVSWLLFPLSLVPEDLLWPVWTLVTCLIAVAICRRVGTEPIFVLLSFPFIGQIWLGQIDMLIVLGAYLALCAPNPYVRGTGLLLMSIKPQVAGPAMLLLLLTERERLKAILVPGLTLVLSLLWWGVDWPLRWISHEPTEHVWGLATLFPLGLAAFASMPLLSGALPRLRASMLATALGVPRYGVYSYSVFLVFGMPWWGVPLSYAWLAAYPWLGSRSMQFAWVLPLGLLARMVWVSVRSNLAATPDSFTNRLFRRLLKIFNLAA